MENSELINKHIGKMWGGLEMASIKHFIETGRINGSFYQRLNDMINEERERAGKLVEALEKWTLAKDEFDSGYSNKSGTMTRVNIAALSIAMTGAENNLYNIFNQYKQSI